MDLITLLRAAITSGGGTPASFNRVQLLQQLVTTYGGTPTKFTVTGLLREAIIARGGTPTQQTITALLRELIVVLGATPTTYTEQALLVQLAGLSIGGVVTPPAPVFSTQPSISPSSGTAGVTAFTATNGVASNTTGYTRRWLLNGSAVSTAGFYTPPSAGSLVLEVTATGPGGPTIATTGAVTVAAAGGGGGGDGTARSAATITRVTGATTYPPQVDFTRPVDWADGDKAIMQWSADATFGSGVSETPTPVTLASGTPTYDFGLSAITSGSRFIRMAAWNGTRPGTLTFSNIINVGDVVAPTVTGGTTSSAENSPMAVSVTASEAGVGTLGGTSAGALELVQLSPTTATVRLAGNANLNYEAQTSYSFTVTWTDYAGNPSTPASFTHNVTNQVENPSGMSFTAVTGATTSTLYSSNTYTVAGLPTGYAAPVSFSGSGGYKKNGGGVVTSAGTVVNGDTLQIVLTSSASSSSTVSGTLTVGGEASPVSATYSVTTVVSLSTNTTWDPTVLGPQSSLTNSNKTLNHTNIGSTTPDYTYSGSRTTTAKSGKRWAEITLSGGADGGAVIGFANSTFNAAADTGFSTGVGGDNNSAGIQADGGYSYGPAQSQVGSNAGFTVGDVINLLSDPANGGTYSWYKNGSFMMSWTNMEELGTSPYIICKSQKALVATFNGGQAAFTNAPPAGAQAWDV